MTTKSSEKPSLSIKRVIKAPRDRVYAAWTDPEQLRQWFGPEEVKTRGMVADIRVGGKYRWDVTDSDGDEMTVTGEYRELVPGKKVVFTWHWEDDKNWENQVSVVTVELSDRGNDTELTLTHEQLPNEQSRDNHNKGWNMVLERLENFFKR